MRPEEERFIRCVVQMDEAAQDDPRDTAEPVCAESFRRLVISELTDDDLRELGLTAHSTAAMTDVPSPIERDASLGTARMVKTTMRVIADQINNLNLETEMLALRKKALKRRLRILERLSKSVRSELNNQEPL